MAEAPQSLHVRYGTFSCTVEGFEDSLQVMKEVALFFRDLVAESPDFASTPAEDPEGFVARAALNLPDGGRGAVSAAGFVFTAEASGADVIDRAIERLSSEEASRQKEEDQSSPDASDRETEGDANVAAEDAGADRHGSATAADEDGAELEVDAALAAALVADGAVLDDDALEDSADDQGGRDADDSEPVGLADHAEAADDDIADGDWDRRETPDEGSAERDDVTLGGDIADETAETAGTSEIEGFDGDTVASDMGGPVEHMADAAAPELEASGGPTVDVTAAETEDQTSSDMAEMGEVTDEAQAEDDEGVAMAARLSASTEHGETDTGEMHGIGDAVEDGFPMTAEHDADPQMIPDAGTADLAGIDDGSDQIEPDTSPVEGSLGGDEGFEGSEIGMPSDPAVDGFDQDDVERTDGSAQELRDDEHREAALTAERASDQTRVSWERMFDGEAGAEDEDGPDGFPDAGAPGYGAALAGLLDEDEDRDRTAQDAWDHLAANGGGDFGDVGDRGAEPTDDDADGVEDDAPVALSGDGAETADPASLAAEAADASEEVDAQEAAREEATTEARGVALRAELDAMFGPEPEPTAEEAETARGTSGRGQTLPSAIALDEAVDRLMDDAGSRMQAAEGESGFNAIQRLRYAVMAAGTDPARERTATSTGTEERGPDGSASETTGEAEDGTTDDMLGDAFATETPDDDGPALALEGDDASEDEREPTTVGVPDRGDGDGEGDGVLILGDGMDLEAGNAATVASEREELDGNDASSPGMAGGSDAPAEDEGSAQASVIEDESDGVVVQFGNLEAFGSGEPDAEPEEMTHDASAPSTELDRSESEQTTSDAAAADAPADDDAEAPETGSDEPQPAVAETGGAAGTDARPSPMVLVSSQRVDAADDEGAGDPPRGGAASTLVSVWRRRNLVAPDDRMMAAAALIADMSPDGVFTRSEVMELFGEASSGPPLPPEERMRAFGLLLRHGRIRRADRGVYALAQSEAIPAE